MFNPTKTLQWQTLLVAIALFAGTALIIQFFFLSEDIDDVRSRNAKLNIAEILAKQQARIESASLTSIDDYEFARAAEKVASTYTSLQSPGTATSAQQQTYDFRSTPEYQALVSTLRKIQLVGVIRHNDYRIAIIQKQGNRNPLVYSEGELLNNSATIGQILDDSIIIQSKKNSDIRMKIKMSSTTR